MAISFDKESIFEQIAPLLPAGTQVQAVTHMSSEPSLGGIVRTAANSGLVGNLLSNFGLSRLSPAINQAAMNTSGSASIYQYYIAVTPDSIRFFNASALSTPTAGNVVPYDHVLSVVIGKTLPNATEIVFNMKNGKSFKYFGKHETIDEVIAAIQTNMQNYSSNNIQSQ